MEETDLVLRPLFNVYSLKGWVTASSKNTFFLQWLLSSDNFPNKARQLWETFDASGLLDLCKTSTRSREAGLCGISTWSPGIDKCILGVHTDISSVDYYSADLDILTCWRLNWPALLTGGSSPLLSECSQTQGIYFSARFHLGFHPFPAMPHSLR